MRFKRPSSILVRAACILLAASVLLVGGSAVIIGHAFDRAVERHLATHLGAFNDLLIAATRVQQGRVAMDNLASLESLPRVWQITSGEANIAKSPLLKTYLPMPENTGVMRIEQTGGGAFYAATKTITFPGNTRVTYMFGIPQDIADQFLAFERREFTSLLLVSLSLLMFGLLVVNGLILRGLKKPLDQLTHAVGAVAEGREASLTGHFPREFLPVVGATNNLLAFNEKMLERYRTFSSNLSHALKTPLSVINNAVAHESSPQAGVIRDKVRSMQGIIDRNLARVRASGAGSLLHSQTPVLPVAARICEGFSKLYHKHYALGETAYRFRGDEADLYEMLGNILDNAFKYAAGEIAVNFHPSAGMLEIVVEDDGKGIPPENIRDIFQRARRLDESVPGTGIGLGITRDIAELYNGAITLADSPLGGLKVMLTLPSTP